MHCVCVQLCLCSIGNLFAGSQTRCVLFEQAPLQNTTHFSLTPNFREGHAVCRTCFVGHCSQCIQNKATSAAGVTGYAHSPHPHTTQDGIFFNGHYYYQADETVMANTVSDTKNARGEVVVKFLSKDSTSSYKMIEVAQVGSGF